MTSSRHSHPRPRVDARRLWASGFATALVAALVVTVGVLVVRGILGIPVLAPVQAGAWGEASTAGYAVAASAGALVATAVLHVVLVATPRPRLFFGWVMTLVTVASGLAPLMAETHIDQEVATGLINVATSVAIWTLLSGSAARVCRTGM